LLCGEQLNSNLIVSDNFKINYHVLKTDYVNYAVVVSCFVPGKRVWILSRLKTLDQRHLDEAFAVLEANKMSPSLLTQSDQNCN